MTIKDVTMTEDEDKGLCEKLLNSQLNYKADNFISELIESFMYGFKGNHLTIRE